MLRPLNTATGKCYACGVIVLASQLTRHQGRAIGSGKHNYCPKCAEYRKAGL